MNERANVKVCSLNKSQTLQQNKNRIKATKAIEVFTSFEYVGELVFSLDDGMMMQFDFILLSAFVLRLETSSVVLLFYRTRFH
jgi:hypothetical protein